MEISTVQDLKNALRAGEFTFPGCYPTFFIAANGDTISHDGVKQRLKSYFESLADQSARDPDLIMAVEINYDDHEMFCAETNKRIPSAYAEDEAIQLVVDDCDPVSLEEFINANSAEDVEPLTDEERIRVYDLEVGQSTFIGICEVKRIA